MAQLTKQDVAEVVKEVAQEVVGQTVSTVVDRKFGALEKQIDSLGSKFDVLERRMGSFDGKFNALEKRMGSFDGKLNDGFEALLARIEVTEDRFEHEFSAFAEHLDDKFDALAEAIQVVNGTVGNLARQSDLQEVRYDIKTIKVAVRATNDDLWY